MSTSSSGTPAAPPSAGQAPAAAPPGLGTGPTPKLAVQNLSVTYISRAGDPVQAVNDVSFSIADKPGSGEVVVFLGPSGCGKSTLLKCIAGLMKPNVGSVKVDGQLVEGTSRDRGMVFQQYTSFAWLSVLENVEYGLRLAGVPKAEREQRGREVLQKVGLGDFAGSYPKALSGGMKQRVAIARTLVNKPRLMLMDEPFGALDPQTRWNMQSLILDISHTLDNTILFVTHDVSEAVYIADTIFILSPRPARIVQRIEVPYFQERTPQLKQTAGFRQLENQVLELLHGQPGAGDIRIG